MNRPSFAFIAWSVLASPALAQSASIAAPAGGAASGTFPSTVQAPRSDIVLGPLDQITVLVGEFPEQFDEKTFRIDGNGDVSLPLVGRLHAGGLSLPEFEEQIKKGLSGILKHPDVVVNVTDFSSATVSVLGAVNDPGSHALVGQKSLFDVLSMSKGLADGAGTTVRITRVAKWGPIPLPGVTTDAANQVSAAIVRVKDVVRNAPDNIAIMAGDAIFVPKAELVYAVGSVMKPGGFPIGEKETISALQVVSLAEGLQRTAAPARAKILRAMPGKPNRTEIAVDIKQLMSGKTPDIPLQPDDILFIPTSGAKTAGFRTIDSIVTTVTGLTVYGRF